MPSEDENGNCAVEKVEEAPEGNEQEVEIKKYYAVFDKYDTSFDQTIVITELDYVMAQYVADNMFCNTSRRSLISNPLRHRGRALDGMSHSCVGVSSEPEEIIIEGECPLSVQVDVGQTCYVMKGGVSLIVSDDSTDKTGEAFDILSTGFSTGAIASQIPELVSLTMASDETAAAAVIAQSETVDETNIAASQSAALTPVATAMLSLGLIAFIALALVALRQKRKRDRAYNEFYDDDDDLVGKDTSSTDSSFDGNDILSDLALQKCNHVDVHRCSSAMCQICNGRRQTTFIETGDNDTVSEIFPDEFEVANEKRSFEYFSKPDASSPRFDNPANIRPRLYEVEDTVSL